VRLVLVTNVGISDVHEDDERHGHIFIDPGDGALYCIAESYKKQVEQFGFRYVKLTECYQEVRSALERGDTETAEQLFYAAKIKGEA
jgi:hypothetical protein